MVMYDVLLDSGDKLTVISDTITHALDVVENKYKATVIDCRFQKKIDKLVIDGELINRRRM